MSAFWYKDKLMDCNSTILVTGGAGYIGSVTCQLLLKENYNIIVVDDLSKGHKDALPKNCKFYQLSTLDKTELEKVFCEHPEILAVIHFAANIEVGESTVDPGKYFYNNVVGSLNVIDLAKKYNLKGFILSSTAAVYGTPSEVPIREEHPTTPINPYGLSKLHVEQFLKYYYQAHKLKYVALRYFNASGAYNNYGEDHQPESHLIPITIKVALKKDGVLNIFGNKYNTKDGTAIRDYIHVEDLATAHILALEAILNDKISNEVFNIGNGLGYSVQEVISLVEKFADEEIPTVITAPRAGDPPILIASKDKIEKYLGWKSVHNLESIIKSAWEWHKNNPNGYLN